MTKTMEIYSIADLHLSDGDKPMDVFGSHWTGHFERIKLDWRSKVGPDDVVLLPGDLSWAMQLPDAKVHLDQIGQLPGMKIIVKGNHDYWWGSISRVREALPKDMFAIQNDAMLIGGVLFAGTRGWNLPSAETTAEDKCIYERELIRLEMTLKAARAISATLPLVCMMHFPPLTLNMKETGFTHLLKDYGAGVVVYGHLHGAALKHAFHGNWAGIEYRCVSADGLDFRLERLDI